MMASGYCVRWTSWRVWFHPRLACRLLRQADKVEKDLQHRLDDALNLLEKQRKETSVQTFHAAELTRQLTDSEKRFSDEHRELEETRIQLTRALDKLDEHKSVDEKLAEFDKELSKIETMKRLYEKRITELEARLGDARRRLQLADDNELVEPINMAEAAHQQAMARKVKELTKYKPQPKTIAPGMGATAPLPYDGASDTLEQASGTETSQGSEDGSAKEASSEKSALAKSIEEALLFMPSKKANRSDDDWLTELPDF